MEDIIFGILIAPLIIATYILNDGLVVAVILVGFIIVLMYKYWKDDF